MRRLTIGLVVFLLACSHAFTADAPAKRSNKDALRAFNDLIGTWRGTGTPEGTREEKQRGFWVESMTWEWQFKGDDAWLAVAFDKSKHFTKGELRYLPEKDVYQLNLQTPGKQNIRYDGKLKDSRLTLDRVDEKKNESQRLVITLLHANRFLYRYEVKASDRPLYVRQYEVGATKEGVPFASGDAKPECVVSGGIGTIAVSYKGQTYYVCCGGCRTAFNEDPERYIKEFKEKKAREGSK